jgi:hypothetical protein
MAARSGQSAHHAQYRGDYDTHAAHTVSVQEQNAYGFSENTSRAFADAGNYR